MSAEDQLWRELHGLFDTDDGSLPEVVLSRLGPTSAQVIFDFLKAKATVDTLNDQTIFHEERQADVAVSEVPDAASLVAAGHIPAFHVVFAGIKIDDVKLPDLGAFFFADQVALDYSMGDQWNPSVLAAFMRLLGDIQALIPEATMSAIPDGGSLKQNDPRFDPALQRYLASADRDN